YDIVHFGPNWQARMDLLLVSIPKGLLRITFISCVSFGELSSVPSCTSNRMASFENVSSTTSRSFEIVITDLRQPGALVPIVGIVKSHHDIVHFGPNWQVRMDLLLVSIPKGLFSSAHTQTCHMESSKIGPYISWNT
ncbi:hypothetical protein IGI04_006097, partial [Brassica rapa subsp. trilocularis]